MYFDSTNTTPSISIHTSNSIYHIPRKFNRSTNTNYNTRYILNIFLLSRLRCSININMQLSHSLFFIEYTVMTPTSIMRFSCTAFNKLLIEVIGRIHI